MNNNLPEEFLSYLKSDKGLEGFLSVDPGYFQLWTKTDIEKNNNEYKVNEYLPDMVGFGSNGGGEMFLFDKSGRIFMVPFIGMSQDELVLVANSWPDFLKNIESFVPKS